MGAVVLLRLVRRYMVWTSLHLGFVLIWRDVDVV